MINSFVQSVKGSTHNITEITRLARLLWPEYVAPLGRNNDNGDPSIGSSVWKALEDLNVSKQWLIEKLDKNIRDLMRSLLSTTLMMPGQTIPKQNCNQYSVRLPYITKFLLLAAFLCQYKRPKQDVNLFTTKNTGKSKRKRSSKLEDGSAYASSSRDLTQRQPSFPLERMLSVFSSIIGQYGQNHSIHYKEEGASVVSQLGTDRLFRNISQLITTGLLCLIGGVKNVDHDLMEMTSAKFSCMISRGDASVIASNVGFPLEKYCP
eukprot:CAMPEP_0181095972 /NCGR_PEP_ID=MMETSP1071-20121207/10790_1 /TAXON_ID=35127 /ORGANISM="Thalassiosira sp., Strain NH16" /LENGTH=263 /DNA_ID=CAMNT_0023178361 /DNA_START=348 /DNA_END=1139 /DNA_ORIENTATION=-